MKRLIALFLAIYIISSLTSCETTYKINHPHVQRPKGKSDRWTKLNISMKEGQKIIFSETSSAAPIKDDAE